MSNDMAREASSIFWTEPIRALPGNNLPPPPPKPSPVEGEGFSRWPSPSRVRASHFATANSHP